MPYGIEEFARLVAKLRQKLGLTQAELGTKIGAPQSYVARFESGMHDIRLSRFLELIRVLGFDVVVLPKDVAAQMRNYYQAANQPELPAYLPSDDEEAPDDAG